MDSIKQQVDAAALSAHSTHDMLPVAEAPDVNIEAIECTPRAGFRLESTLTLRYRNSGRTPADNVESAFSIGIPSARPTTEPTVAATEVSADSVSAGASMPAGTTETVGDMLSRSSGGIPSGQTFQKIVAGDLKFGIWGYVAYTDVVGGKHRKHFEYAWDRNFPNACLFTEMRASGQ